MDKRPKLTTNISVTDFKDFYWLKKELTAFCKSEDLQTRGSKLEVAKRIEVYLKTGQKQEPSPIHKFKPASTFDWNSAPLSVDTIITDNYSNTENVRSFFAAEIGPHFKFNVAFMNWMKENHGLTLQDAITEWQRINTEKKSNTQPKKIAPQFEYNTYLRDFLKDNPIASRETGIQLWNIKKSMRGKPVYSREDLKLIDK